jgi:hypothetical protein
VSHKRSGRTIAIVCPDCHYRWRVPRTFAGCWTRCPKCDTSGEVPSWSGKLLPDPNARKPAEPPRALTRVGCHCCGKGLAATGLSDLCEQCMPKHKEPGPFQRFIDWLNEPRQPIKWTEEVRTGWKVGGLDVTREQMTPAACCLVTALLAVAVGTFMILALALASHP